MIGGYLYHRIDKDIDARLIGRIKCCPKMDLWDIGYLFYSDPFQSDQKSFAVAPDMAALTEDLLVRDHVSSGYRLLDLESDFLSAQIDTRTPGRAGNRDRM